MRAIMVMFDTLNRGFLPPYGAEGIHAPNFDRLAERSTTFDTCYAGSMPCMPARREMHTGRYNFLHRSWGPLEPFDDSVPELLSEAGVYTHLVTDHQHYWEDGGATYHSRYDTFEFFRGQEGDRWKGHVRDPEPIDTVSRRSGSIVRQDRINRAYYPTAESHPQTLTVDAGVEFLRTNVGEDSWFLQIECFDPHEPFVSYPEHRRWYRTEDGDDATPADGAFDWPDYGRVGESEADVDHMREQYSSLLSMCDASLGRVLDEMDAQGLWEDTLLIVCTDHGLLLGERGWWGKNVQPWFEENIHTPLFIWDPRSGRAGDRTYSLVQTIDFGATLLEYFGLPQPPDMLGSPIGPILAEGAPPRAAGLFGSFGGHVNVTDGRFVYMRSCATPANEPLFEHTLMPTHMASRFRPDELREAELIAPLSFTKGAPVLRMPAASWGDPWSFGTLLFDLQEDPDQLDPLVDPDLERRMATMLVAAMKAAGAPSSQFERLGLPENGHIDDGHLLAAAQRANAREALTPLPRRVLVAERWPMLLVPLVTLADEEGTWATVLEHLPMLADSRAADVYASSSIYELAQALPALGASTLAALGDALARDTVAG